MRKPQELGKDFGNINSLSLSSLLKVLVKNFWGFKGTLSLYKE